MTTKNENKHLANAKINGQDCDAYEWTVQMSVSNCHVKISCRNLGKDLLTVKDNPLNDILLVDFNGTEYRMDAMRLTNVITSEGINAVPGTNYYFEPDESEKQATHEAKEAQWTREDAITEDDSCWENVVTDR